MCRQIKELLVSELPSKSRRKQHETVATVSNVTVLVSDSKLADAGVRRLQLREATELAGKLYDEISTKGSSSIKYDSDYDVLRVLSYRKLFLELLTHELNIRKLLPVTLNTLSTVLAQTYTRLR
jgi:hypothetical protein